MNFSRDYREFRGRKIIYLRRKFTNRCNQTSQICFVLGGQSAQVWPLLPLDLQTGSGKLKKTLFLVGILSSAEFCSVLTNGCLNLLVVQSLLSVRTLQPWRSNAHWPASSGGLQCRAWVCSAQSALKASLAADFQHQLAKKQSTQNHVDAFGGSGFIATNSRTTKANHYFPKCPACFDWSIHFCSI